jgi:hypothetical protein
MGEAHEAKRNAGEGYPTGLQPHSNFNQVKKAPAGWLCSGAFVRVRGAGEPQDAPRALKNLHS